MPVVLHINGRNSAGALAVVDRTAAHVALSYAGTTPVADTTNPKFGGASVRLNNGPIYVSDASVLIGQTEDFTIQGWFEWESVSQVAPVLFGQRATAGYSPVSVWLIPSSGVIELYAASASLTVFRSTYAFTPTLGAWYHVAVTRNGGTMTLWLNGNPVVVLSIGAGTALFATTPFCIGGTNDNDYRLPFDGRFDDFQVVRGQALYTAAFTPPSELAAPDDPGYAATASGGSSALAVGRAVFTAVATSSGGSAASAVAKIDVLALATSAGASTGAAVGRAQARATGQAVGTSSATAVGRSTVPGEGLRASCLRFDLASKRMSSDETLAAQGAPGGLYSDLRTDTLYVASGTAIRPAHASQAVPAVWRSKVFKIPSGARQGFAWMRLRGTFASGMTVRVYADGVLQHTKLAVKSLEPMRMPAHEARAWEVELVGADHVTGVWLVDSTEELL